jgi:signal transduction histidine kinase
MKLRSQLLLVSLSVLVLPWAGWQLLRLLGEVLREGQEQAVLASAEALSRGMALRGAALPPAGPSIYAQALPRRPQLDGGFDDWPPGDAAPQTLHPSAAGTAGSAARLWLGSHDDTVFARIEVDDATPARTDAHWPIAGRRDHLRLVLHGRQGVVDLRLANADSGPLIVTGADGAPPPLGVRGAWRDGPGGYAVELALPQGYLLRALQLSAFDAPADGSAPPLRLDTGPRPLAVLQRSDSLANSLAQLVPAGLRAQLLDGDGRLLAQAGELSAGTGAAAPPGWRRGLYQRLLVPAAVVPGTGAAADPAPAGVRWLRDDDGGNLRLAATVPVLVAGQARAQLRLERDGGALLRLGERAFSGLFGLSLLALGAVVVALALFAGRLAGRIRRLRDAAERALDRDGKVQAFPVASAGDEIGDLSRSFSSLLHQVEAWTGYLRGLAGTLSHELSTPIAIVRSSLENLEADPHGPLARTYIERARSGVDRLAALVRAMSEATRIEQAIAGADIEAFDLRALIADCAEGHRPLLAPRRLDVVLPPAALPFTGAPDLIAQALDKLVDNARGFCPPDGWVRIELTPSGDGARLAVANTGPPLPAHMRERLFDSMVSVRPSRGDGIHLGLGLHIVKLVAQLHRGSVAARDLDGAAGVEFTVRLSAIARRVDGTQP